MLRPATPLSIIFLVAFVLLLLSTLSTPVIEGIPLGSYQNINFGVLGYCHIDTGKCFGPIVGYSTDGLFSGSNTDSEFSLPSDARHSLSSILIVHPVAALLALICFILAVAAHFHGPSHSPRYLLALLILTFPTLLITLLAFLVDILLFVPHMAWGGWIVLAATILIVASSIVTCAMRRTLVSRKARKKRIAENADMNGANYYESLAQQRMMADTLPKADSPPPMSGSTAVDQSTAHFPTYEMTRQDTRVSDHHDDRVPLNPTRDPSIRSASTNGRYTQNENVPPMPSNGRSNDEYGNGMPQRPSRDQYGNPIPADAELGMVVAPGLRHQHSQGSLGSNRSGGYSQRGRGGYGPPPRGYGPPRGGYGPPRGAYGPRGGRGGYGPPPPGWRGRGGHGLGPGMMGRGGPPPRQGPPPGYGRDPYYSGPRAGPPPPLNQPPSPMYEQHVGPDAIGQAVEMDERAGSAPRQDAGYSSNPYGLRDSDVDVAGMVGLQHGQSQAPQEPVRQESHRESERRSPSSVYSTSTHVPPQQHWAAMPEPFEHDYANGTSRTEASSFSNPHPQASRAVQLSPITASPMQPSVGGLHSPQHRRKNSEPYYEDVDPRFAQEEPVSPLLDTDFHGMDTNPHANRESGIPNALTPGSGQHAGYRMDSPPPISRPTQPPDGTYLSPEAYRGAKVSATNKSNSTSSVDPPRPGSDNSQGLLEPIPDGARSPGGGSDASHYTSVSQRPVNPNWRPAGSGMAPQGIASTFGGSSASAVQRRKEDVILTANPDFSVPGIGLPGRGRGRGRGGAASGSLRDGPMAAASSGLTPAGRYPTDI